MNEQKLKPCPFCGGEAKMLDYWGNYIFCRMCGAKIPRDVKHYDQVEEKLFKVISPAQPKIIKCKDCKWYGRVDKRRFYRGMDCLQKRIDTIIPDEDFCSRAERRCALEMRRETKE